jgi:hypothetical protein
MVHAAAEATGLPDSSQDLVSICLVCHELPQVGGAVWGRGGVQLSRVPCPLNLCSQCGRLSFQKSDTKARKELNGDSECI